MPAGERHIPNRHDAQPPSEPPGKGGVRVVVQQPTLFRLDTLWGRQEGSHSFKTSGTILPVGREGTLSEDTNIHVRNGGAGEGSFQISSHIIYKGAPTPSFHSWRRAEGFTQALREQGLDAQVQTLGRKGRKRPQILVINPDDPHTAVVIDNSTSIKQKAETYFLDDMKSVNPELDTANIRSLVQLHTSITMGKLGQYDPKSYRMLYSLGQANTPEWVQQYARLYETIVNTLYQGFEQSPPDEQIIFRPPAVGTDTVEQVYYEKTDRPRFLEGSSDLVTFEDVAGQEEAVDAAKRLVLAIQDPDSYGRRGVKQPKGILFHGPPGTGKTLLARAIANESGAEFISITSADITSKWYGDAEKLMQRVFNKANETVLTGIPVIIFIDEVDAIASARQGSTFEATRRVLSVLLQNIDGMKANPSVTILAATNDLDALDPAFTRPGRMDKTIRFKELSPEGKLKILRNKMDSAQSMATGSEELFDPAIDLQQVAEALKKLTGAAVANLINAALENNLMDELEGNPWRPITTEDLVELARSFNDESSSVKTVGFKGSKSTP